MVRLLTLIYVIISVHVTIGIVALILAREAVKVAKGADKLQEIAFILTFPIVVLAILAIAKWHPPVWM